MDWGKLSYWSRKIHRWTLLLVVILGGIQMLTGIVLKYPSLFSSMDMGTVLFIHESNAGYFATVFTLQMVTGILMYLTPWLLKTFHKSPPPPQA